MSTSSTSPTTIATIENVPVLWDGRVLTWTAGLRIDADGSPRAYGPHDSGLDYTQCAGRPGNWWGIVTDIHGNPVVQGPDDPAPGFYVSTTTYQRIAFNKHDPRRYLNSETVEYVVVPSIVRRRVPPIVIGCHCVVTHVETGRSCIAVCGDVGPAGKIGEGSIALAKALGIPSDPRRGGTEAACLRYELHPGVPCTLGGETFQLQGA